VDEKRTRGSEQGWAVREGSGEHGCHLGERTGRSPARPAVRVLGEGHLAPRIESREKNDNEKKREAFLVIALLQVI
jgi:hypothetical protein